MTGKKPGTKTSPTQLGIYDRPPARPSVTGIEIAALALSVAWLVISVIFFVVVPGDDANADSVSMFVTMLAIFMPVAMIWVAAMAARASRVMREESQRLQAAIDAIRNAYVSQQQNAAISSEPSVTRKLDEIVKTAKKTETTLATFSTKRRGSDLLSPEPAAEPAPAEPDEQATLALGNAPEDMAPPMPRGDFIHALNFPESADDTAGFSALRRALKNRQSAQLIQAAQDVLTLLSQEGIYMDDLRPDMARPEIWRQFAQGARGRAVASLGGVRDRSSLALTSGRMKQDPIFRDAAHHFLRRFDQMFTEFEPDASDAEISALSETRTARAFMLLGRVAGTFD
ncbi:hypothetical protein Q5Y75_09670 [Ruegeria sp. 2205SS24-7]|uniref:hypothetical protein n=1 Tax=Ruegeria discodermiae TaxID=3064389 RepID=UPI0027416C65|nr:hypothetical protein [Ruegeria sp. 2205SS24-7]MDP5217484.1 hypothetical protein [Ruegeria sp. 2205SS24-7]